MLLSKRVNYSFGLGVAATNALEGTGAAAADIADLTTASVDAANRTWVGQARANIGSESGGAGGSDFTINQNQVYTETDF